MASTCSVVRSPWMSCRVSPLGRVVWRRMVFIGGKRSVDARIVARSEVLCSDAVQYGLCSPVGAAIILTVQGCSVERQPGWQRGCPGERIGLRYSFCDSKGKADER